MNRRSALYKLPNTKLDEHENGLCGIDYHQKLELFATGGPDQTVKIFNLKKEILKEIKFPQPVSGVVFLNPAGDLMIGHNEKVSVVNYSELAMPNRSTVISKSDKLAFVGRRQKVTWKTFARLKLYEDSLKDKNVTDLEFEKLVEEEDVNYFNEKQDVKVTGHSKLSRPNIKAGHTVIREESIAMDLTELNIMTKE